MLPLLLHLADGEHSGQETVDAMAKHFALTPDEVSLRLPSGTQTKFVNRIAWAKSHLKAAGLIESPRRGVYRLTDRGRDVLKSPPPALKLSFLTQYPEYVVFRGGAAKRPSPASPGPAIGPAGGGTDVATPEELIDEGYVQLRASLASDLREHIASMPPAAFEQLVVDLLQAMGYGGPQENAGLVVGRGGDEGIDGVIKQDRLGLETIYLQAKRWKNTTVGRPEIHRFAGALQGQQARKGVFITASSFSAEARSYPASIATTIVLIDGAQLAELMIDHNVGVAITKRLEIKRVDSDYFAVE